MQANQAYTGCVTKPLKIPEAAYTLQSGIVVLYSYLIFHSVVCNRVLRVIPIRRLYHRNFECNDYLPYRVIIDPRFTTEIGDCRDQ